MLNEIRNTLKSLDKAVYYGGVDLPDAINIWDYIVFARDNTQRTKNNTGYTDYIAVAIVNEEYIPEGFVDAVIDAMEGISGVRLTDDGVGYEYTRKPNTKVIVETAHLTFAFPRKKCKSHE